MAADKRELRSRPPSPAPRCRPVGVGGECGPGPGRAAEVAPLYVYDPTRTSPSDGEVEDWMAFDAAVRDSGAFVHEAGFHPRDEGRIVRLRDGAATVEEEPAAPAANTVAGCYVVEATDIDAACDLAARPPTAAYGYVEVRQVVEFSWTCDHVPPQHGREPTNREERTIGESLAPSTPARPVIDGRAARAHRRR